MRLPSEYSARLWFRNFLLPLAALASVFIFPSSWFVTAFIILGQAHFAMAMLYQYRGGRVTRRYVLTALVLLALFILYFASGGGFYPIFYAAVFMFGAHFAYDEFHLQKTELGAPQKVTLILFVLLFIVMNVYVFLPGSVPYALALSLVFPAYIAARLFFSTNRPNRAEAYIWFVGILLFFLAFVAHIQPVILLAIVSILHIVNWYIDYGRRLADGGDTKRLRAYWTEVVLLIAAIALGYAAYRVFQIDILGYYYGITYYYAFALAHFVLSFRRQGRNA